MSKDNEHYRDINKDSAFGSMTRDKFGYINTQAGLTKREYMATQILPSVVTVSVNLEASAIVYRTLEITDELIRRLKE